MYDDICACSELRDRCFKKAEQARDLHSVHLLLLFIIIIIIVNLSPRLEPSCLHGPDHSTRSRQHAENNHSRLSRQPSSSIGHNSLIKAGHAHQEQNQLHNTQNYNKLALDELNLLIIVVPPAKAARVP